MRQSSQEIEKRIKEIMSAPAQPFPSFTGDEQRAYDSIKEQLLSRAGVIDPRAEVYPPLQPTLLDLARRPTGIPEDPWNAVMDQLRIELSYKQGTHQLFKLFDSFFQYVFAQNLNYLNQASQLAQATMEEEASFILKSILSASQAAIGEIGIPGAGLAIALMNIVLEKAQEDGDVSRETVAGTIAALHAALAKDFAGYRNGTQKIERQIMYRWGSLKIMGRSLASGEIKWPPDDQISKAAIHAYKISIWKILLPVVWNLMKPQKDPEFYRDIAWFDKYIEVNPHYYLRATRSGNGYVVYMQWLGRGATIFNHQEPTKTMCVELFLNLKVPRPDVFEEKNGWKGFTRQTLIECSGGQLAMELTDERELFTADFIAQLDALRRLREDLGKSDMGRWYLRVYDEIAPLIMHLYERDPARDIERAINRYEGRDAYNALIKMIQTRNQTSISEKQADNIVAIITVVINTSVKMLGEKNPVQLRAEAILPRLFPYIGRSYAQVMEILQTEKPPQTKAASSKKGTSRAKGRARRQTGKRTGGKGSKTKK